jgi:HK97 family phage prohead protease
METKTYNTEKIERIKSLDYEAIDIDKKQGIIKAYINKFNVIDAYNEMSLPGSFTKTFRERLKKMWWLLNHEWEKSLGVTLELFEDGIGAIAVGKFNLEKRLSQDVFSDYQFFAENGRTLQHSVRVIPIQYLIKNGVMEVSEWKQREWSTLTQPGAIEDTPLLSIKSEIDFLQKAGKYDFSDERLKAFEDKIKQLEALITKADAITLQNENAKKIRETMNFINNLTF